MREKYRSLILVGLVFCIIIGCNSVGKSSKVVGKWQSVSRSKVSIEFFSDNTLQYNGGNEAKGLAGKWVILDDGRVKIEITGPFGGKATEVGAFKGNNIELNFDGNHAFTKIK